MTGETDQPGGRAPAPGSLALVQAFLNTHYDLGVEHGAEVWQSPAAYARWLRAHDLIDADVEVDRSELRRGLRVRDALRTLASEQPEWRRGARGAPPAAPPAVLAALNEAGSGAGVEVRFRPDGPSFSGDGTAAGAVGVVLAAAAVAMVDGTWPRLKICPGRDCGWAFYDHSRNGSSRWCSMSICGDREKARAYYRRTRGDV